MSDETEQTVNCENCGRDIPESKSFLHEAYCMRNVIRCPKCNEPVDKNEMEEHNNESHKLGACKYCKKDMEKRLLEEHEGSCLQKPKMCQYCNCEVSTEEFSQHVYRCGSRTKKCDFCNKNILVRDFEDHEPVCQIKHENYGENFPSMQEEKKETSANPYSGLSSKYMASATPSTNPYESLNQAPKSRNKESSTSKHESQPKRSSAAEEPKASSKPELKNQPLSTKTSSSSSQKPQESSSYNYSKHREEKTSSTTGPSVTSKYSVPDTKIPSVLDSQKPYSYQKEDPNTGYRPYSREDPYKAGGYGARTNDVTSYTAATSTNPTTQTTASTKYTPSYLENLATRGQPDSLSKGIGSYGTTGVTGEPRIGSSNRPKVGENYGTSYSHNVADSSKTKATTSTTGTTGAKYDPFSKAGMDSINKYSRPEDLKPSVSSQNRVGATEKTYLRGDSSKGTSGTTSYSKPADYSRPEDKKQFLSDFQRSSENHNYPASRSNQPQTTGLTSGITGNSSNLNKKYEAPKYEDPSRKASKLTDFSSKPTIDSRTQASKADPRSYEKKESIGTRPTGVSSHKTSDATRTRDTGVSSHSSQSRKNAPTQNVPAYNPSNYVNEIYEDDYGVNQDPELQKAIQESIRAAGKKPGQSGQSSQSSQGRRNRDVDVNQSIDDPDLARAIQESLQTYGQR